MKLLWDTHAVIWYITNDPKLPFTIRERIEAPDAFNYVSLASYWELSIKYSLGRLEFKHSLERIFEIIGESGFELLEITSAHLLFTAKLPFHHRDPFDRLIIGTALEQGMKVITKDRQFVNYREVELIWE